jgi:6-phosphogluconate dehydrogenase
MQGLLGLKPAEMGEIFTEWNRGELDSFLIEITADILKQKDPDRKAFVDVVLDTAGQKGTGKWTGRSTRSTWASAAYDSSPRPCSPAASPPSRKSASPPRRSSRAPAARNSGEEGNSSAIRDALYCSKICSYAQGFQLMRAGRQGIRLEAELRRASPRCGAAAASSARASCSKITEAYEKNPNLVNLLLDPFFTKTK